MFKILMLLSVVSSTDTLKVKKAYSAVCKDGVTMKQMRVSASGMCSGHKGVEKWLVKADVKQK